MGFFHEQYFLIFIHTCPLEVVLKMYSSNAILPEIPKKPLFASKPLSFLTLKSKYDFCISEEDITEYLQSQNCKTGEN